MQKEQGGLESLVNDMAGGLSAEDEVNVVPVGVSAMERAETVVRSEDVLQKASVPGEASSVGRSSPAAVLARTVSSPVFAGAAPDALEKAEKTRHGVLGERTLVQVVENRWQERTIAADLVRDLGGLCALAEEERLTHLWVLATVEADQAYVQAAEPHWNVWTNWRYGESKRVPAAEHFGPVRASSHDLVAPCSTDHHSSGLKSVRKARSNTAEPGSSLSQMTRPRRQLSFSLPKSFLQRMNSSPSNVLSGR